LLVSPIRDHAFFEQTQFKRLLGDDLLQGPCFTAKVRHFAAGGRTGRVARQPTFAGFKELLRPAVIKALGDTFPPAQLGNTGLATQAVQDNADLLLRRILLAVARRMFFTSRSDGELAVLDFCLISFPSGLR